MKQIKVINRIPTPADMIANQVLKLTAFDRFTSFAFPLLLSFGWLLILFAIFSS